MYKKALQLKLRIQTNKGLLSVEQVMTLGISTIESLVKEAYNKIKDDLTKDLDFLDNNTSKVNEVDNLRFNILKDIYLTKIEEKNSVLKEKKIREREQYLLTILEEKKDASIRNKSAAEIEQMIEDLRK